MYVVKDGACVHAEQVALSAAARLDTRHLGGAPTIHKGISIAPPNLFSGLVTVRSAMIKSCRGFSMARVSERPRFSVPTHRMTLQWFGARLVMSPYALRSVIR